MPSQPQALPSTASSASADLRRGLALGALGVFIFALSIPMTRLASGSTEAPQLPPEFVALGRAALAGLLSIAYLRWTGAPRPQGRQWALLAFTALGVVFGWPLLLGYAVRQVDAVHASVISGVLPLATAVIAALALRQRPSLGFWACAVAGLALVLGFAWWRGAAGLQTADLLLLGAVLSAAAGYVSGAQLSAAIKPEQVISWVLVLSLPLLMLLAALSLVFESLPWMRSALGNGVVVLLLGVLMSQAVLRSERGAAEPLGISVLVPDMRAALLSQVPQEKLPGYTLGSGFTSATQLRQQGVFQWNGMAWTARQVLTQWAFVLPAAGLLGLAACFHAAYVARGRRMPAAEPLARRKQRGAPAAPLAEAEPRGAGRLRQVLRLPPGLRRFGPLLWAELRLLLRQPRWWQAGALALMVAGALLTGARAQHDLLLASLAWAALMLAPAGGRAPAHDAGALLGSSACGGERFHLLQAEHASHRQGCP